jgi:hypothetical protein
VIGCNADLTVWSFGNMLVVDESRPIEIHTVVFSREGDWHFAF